MTMYIDNFLLSSSSLLRSPMCRLIAAEDLWALLDALQEPVPEEVHQHLENINSSTTPLMVRRMRYCIIVPVQLCYLFVIGYLITRTPPPLPCFTSSCSYIPSSPCSSLRCPSFPFSFLFLSLTPLPSSFFFSISLLPFYLSPSHLPLFHFLPSSFLSPFLLPFSSLPPSLPPPVTGASFK